MIVVSDTSPINYLVLIGHIDVLPALFGAVCVPAAVGGELERPGAPEIVRRWLADLPSWLSIRKSSRINEGIGLGAGEVEAISLAMELHADLLLMDDRLGRRAAEARGLSVVGTLNVLEAAAERDLLHLPAAIAKLRHTNFHIAEHILVRALAVDAERRGRSGKETRG